MFDPTDLTVAQLALLVALSALAIVGMTVRRIRGSIRPPAPPSDRSDDDTPVRRRKTR